MADNLTEYTDFPIEYFNEVNEDERLQTESETRLRDLAKGHTDITGASVSVRDANLGRESGVEVTITVYSRPEHLAATVTAPHGVAAVKGALDAIERQVRERRERMRGY